MAILVVGSTVAGEFSYEALMHTMTALAGEGAKPLLGMGLLAAGFSSAITAPLAAAITVHSMYGGQPAQGAHRSRVYRAVWILVLTVGFGFGVADVRPIPAIILAQGINGVLLPLVAIVLILAVNDPAVMPRRYLNHAVSNVLLLLIVGTTTLLGLTNLARAFTTALGQTWMTDARGLPYLAGLSALITVGTAIAVYRRRRQVPENNRRG
jgi:manganese transport protein